jgi:hypothetical protein
MAFSPCDCSPDQRFAVKVGIRWRFGLFVRKRWIKTPPLLSASVAREAGIFVE